MKTSKAITASIAVIIAGAAAIAAPAKESAFKPRLTAHEITISMIANHDADKDGALNEVELANAIEAMYAHQQNAIKARRDVMIQSGVLSEADANGIITLRLLPEDGAAILIKGSDANGNNVLEADELAASVPSFRKLNLGARTAIAPRAS